jgi:hypothetical protein
MDLATLHYVTFIEPFGVFSTEPLSFNSEQFMNNSISNIFESKLNGPFLLFEEHFFAVVLLYKKSYEMQLLSPEIDLVNFGLRSGPRSRWTLKTITIE